MAKYVQNYNSGNNSVQSSGSGWCLGEVVGLIFKIIGIILLVAMTLGFGLIWVCTGICSTADALNGGRSYYDGGYRSYCA